MRSRVCEYMGVRKLRAECVGRNERATDATMRTPSRARNN